ncbi:major facilitator superfamily domain-containing protein [Pyronema domesticum]|nr:major facilitator superfamily domain-containing protein [Pyronema domesticum]
MALFQILALQVNSTLRKDVHSGRGVNSGRPNLNLENKLLFEAGYLTEERRLLFKIDWFILSFCCAAFFCNQLDRSNINNAYVSGMKDLNMHGNQITKTTAVFTGEGGGWGYILGMIPNNLMILRVAPHIRFPFTILASSGLLGQMTSGALQSGIYKTLHNHHGMAGWRWLFIIDACITLSVAIYGWFLFPDTLEKTRVGYLTPAEKELAVTRLPKREETHLDWTVWKRVLGRWHFYGFVVLWTLGGEMEGLGKHNLLGLYLQDMGRSILDRNNYPMVALGIGIIAALSARFYIDITGQHWHVGLYVSLVGIVSSVLILACRPESLVFAGHYLAGQIWCVQTYEERSIVLATMNMSNMAWTAWFTRGCWAMVGCGVVLAAWCSGINWMQEREERGRKGEEKALDRVKGVR